MFDRASFREQVLHAVRKIPKGKVTSYGHIARLAGNPRRARIVGNILAHASPQDEVPWQRVINAQGVISIRNPSTTKDEQKEKLEDEGVEFIDKYQVDLVVSGWFPSKA
mmetsp:Transcript_13375/g.21936  ORF Transcript_13375/g.21936 Transcript_13375/m.21936 type:complete len:109 (-) Transcript_13375:743-1069(-)|eukprot:CAMPEP_0184649700 /NCGR_PEP_ID=MMETSP0308-20130426/7106_1 /TAXON_ID=38269 /ORGANISM="Gloeochaete witrockiana, Strain SAG 46.84" /LENGTH=108 /DNA_ID=CAMNT_0027082619 /DNA_START=75 /DNA_END=401 /DNA_ORIENTATION=-